MIKNIFVIEGSPETWEDAISLTYLKLMKEGYVKETFLKACIDREKEFPTGLPTEIPIAIPHTFAHHVVATAICVLKPDKPVRFASMENPEDTINAEFIFNLALKNEGDQVKMLRAIIDTARSKNFRQQSKELSLNELRDIFYTSWFENE